MADNLTHDELSKMKVADLKKLLKAKGLSMTGTKSDLVERLKAEMSPVDLATEETKVSDDGELPGEREEESVEEEGTPKESKTENTVKPTTQDTKAEPTSPTLITGPPLDTDILKKRAERFGVVNEDTKKQQRAERFGVVSEDLKKEQRAARFGITPVSSPSQGSKLSTSSAEDVDKLKERAKRFGQVLSSSLSKVDEDERIKKRKERFGDVTAATNNRPAKFTKITYANTNSQDEEMKKKRAERFGTAS